LPQSEENMKKILITGSSGLVGNEVVSALKKDEDWKIFAATSREAACTAGNVCYINNVDLERVLREEKIDVLLQLAFPRNVREDQWARGMEFSAHVLGLAYRYSVGKVINVSSQSIFGWQRTEPARESDGVILNSPYTTGKYWSELMVNEMFAGIPHTNVRLSTIIGPTTAERVPNKFFAQITAGEILKIKGGQQIFSFMDVRDAARGLIELIKTQAPLRPVYNLGTKEYATLLEIAKLAVNIGAEHGYTSGIQVEEADIVLNNRMDVSAMEKDFGWKAVYTLKESMENIYRQNYQV